jgi:limonene-1,2-epoxide hydrolase
MSQTATTPDGSATSPDDPAAVVRSFLERLEALDLEGALGFADPEIVYHNKGLPPARGRAEVARQLGTFLRYANRFEARLHNLAADGPVVLTERTDVIGIGRVVAEFWVCGTFEVRDGRIVLWRDYFDYVNVTAAMARGLVKALFRR